MFMGMNWMPVSAVDLLFGNFSKHFFHDALAYGVAIVIRILQKFTVFSEQSIVHAPSVDADAREFHSFRGRKRLAHFQPQTRNVPVQAPPYSTGSLRKRWTSSVVRKPDCNCARTARPLSAPKSNAK